MKRTLTALMALGGLAAASPSAYVEKAFEFGYAYPATAQIGVEYPLTLDLPVDIGLESSARFNFQTQKFGGEFAAKALLFPSLSVDPPMAVALRADVNAGTDFWGVHAGPLISFDFTEFTVNAGVYPGFGTGGFQLGYHAGFRYYFDMDNSSSLDLAFRNNTFTVSARFGF
ncbi:hypothetical protein DC3_55030 [Deinococcus cellulosilyticus NBRC 106333 = KACC 11606]|uniref:Outer membrane protein beta-barrel domain-containing protein n=2 Tax=Deinococcus cellulosilyticus TaxID=401558 RepID=A0A511NBH8_DEIC1|nr:hypothetical protein DC3_55030 [Deinococcus cellulosilyticus NBRC 106333 = KACC 11606]